ncbi:endonuclease III domain-containing protein [Schleiferilactobacillus perolens]|uniref:endonuclease III domain-containing protein n=1 Tax=Schleiferilactobacillus perolens TaxID=100468 RepID=UPI002352B376|nr:endonuclease III [Schleiferilactobacillus perolens]MCI2170173.1 endonuclease III [Schleiferilactobacillus perolens]
MQLRQLYNMLFDHYGDQGWWPGRSDWEIIFGSILIQNTNWRNVDKAIAALFNQTEFWPANMRQLTTDQLGTLIRPAGFYTRKVVTIEAMLDWLANYNDDLTLLRRQDPRQTREELVALKGIGEETANDILLYVLSVPTMIIDTYTRRFFKRFGVSLPTNYQTAQKQLLAALPNFTLRSCQNFHALIVAVEKEKYSTADWQDLPWGHIQLEWKQ